MQRRSRQLSVNECYEILKVDKKADLQAVKHAYRLRAFELHPDLNPNNPDASRQFQLLNEAYVALSAVLKPTADAEQKEKRNQAENNQQHARHEANGQHGQRAEYSSRKAQSHTHTDDAQRQTTSQHAERNAQNTGGGKQQGYAEQDVLRDLLNDPFARRVFEDIYSELNKQQAPPKTEKEEKEAPPKSEAAYQDRQEKKSTSLHKDNIAWGTPKWNPDLGKGVGGVVKDWLRNQIDEKQSLTMPAAALAPGRKIRLQIRRGLSGELHTVEITLPQDFAIGKPFRLRGLGKRVGPWQGDMYLTLYNG